MAFFPLYFLENPLYMQKVVATPHIGSKTYQIIFGGSGGIETAICTISDENMHFGIFWDTLVYVLSTNMYGGPRSRVCAHAN